MRSRDALFTAWGLLAIGAAVALPALAVPEDLWFRAGDLVRAEARRGDLVVLTPRARLDRLRAFDGVWAVAADAHELGDVTPFRRVFVVSEGAPPFPLPGWRVASQRRIGRIHVRVLEPVR